MENSLFYTQFNPLNAGNRLLGFCNVKIFWGSMPPDTPWKRGLLIQSITLFNPAGYFNFYWNPRLSQSRSLGFLVRQLRRGQRGGVEWINYNSTLFDSKKWQLHRLSKCHTLLTTAQDYTLQKDHAMTWILGLNQLKSTVKSHSNILTPIYNKQFCLSWQKVHIFSPNMDTS